MEKFSKFNKILLIIMLTLMPTMVYASGGSDELTIGEAIFMEAFISLHMSFFVLLPLARIFSEEDSNKLFWMLFIIRAGILLYCDFFVTPYVAIIDFILFFICVVLVVPICEKITGKSGSQSKYKSINSKPMTAAQTVQTQMKGVTLRCNYCNKVLNVTDTVCSGCGAPFTGNNVKVENTVVQKTYVTPVNYDKMYSMSESQMLEEFLNREIIKLKINNSKKLIPADVIKRKKVLSIIFSILVFFFVSALFFHLSAHLYIIGLVILFIFYKVANNYNLIKYLKKQVKARPSEKISNIVMNAQSTLVNDNSRTLKVVGLIVALVAPLIIFSSPRIIYEKVDNGYAVRFYTFGLTNFKTATIPETYKNEKVVSLRGNMFSYMPLLESVSLPDTITEIRGQAFKNCYKLKEVNIPKNLEYLGGGAFYNAKSIKSIELPDTLTFLGGEAFYGADSLETIRLSENLTEIKGNTFEHCTLLTGITIPDKVTRIGGHAFYAASSLSYVNISENSQLREIGSSAFRLCDNLHKITLPENVYVNERAFKESPTRIEYYGSFDDNTYRTYGQYR